MSHDPYNASTTVTNLSTKRGEKLDLSCKWHLKNSPDLQLLRLPSLRRDSPSLFSLSLSLSLFPLKDIHHAQINNTSRLVHLSRYTFALMDSIKKQATDESPHIVEMGTITELTTTRTPPNSTSTITATSTTCTGAHRERHTSHSDVVRDTIIGFADGLTVPFALTAGLSSLGSGRLVVLAGLAELCSGALSMGLGAYLAAATAQKHYEVEEARERREVREQPLDEEEEIYEIMAAYGVSRGAVSGVVEELKRCPEQWVNVSDATSSFLLR